MALTGTSQVLRLLSRRARIRTALPHAQPQLLLHEAALQHRAITTRLLQLPCSLDMAHGFLRPFCRHIRSLCILKQRRTTVRRRPETAPRRQRARWRRRQTHSPGTRRTRQQMHADRQHTCHIPLRRLSLSHRTSKVPADLTRGTSTTFRRISSRHPTRRSLVSALRSPGQR